MFKWFKLQYAIFLAWRESRAEQRERQLMHEANCAALLTKCMETGEVWTGQYDQWGNWIMKRPDDL